jgi:Rgg/GadR/MutR family transcriptional activator
MEENCEMYYGEVFRDFRRRKNLSERRAYKGVCSRSTLRNFEMDKRKISINKLIGLLANIEVTETEYFAAVKNYILSKNEAFIKIALYYYRINDQNSLQAMLEEKRSFLSRRWNDVNHLHILLLSVFLNELKPNFHISQKELTKASEYFFTLDKWTYHEIALFGNLAPFLTMGLVSLVISDFLKQKETLFADRMMRSHLIRTLLNASYSFIGYKNLDEASYFLDYAESLMKTQGKEDIIFEHYMFKFMKGFYYLVDGDIDKGKKLMKTAINLFKINEIPELVKRYKHYYKEAMKQVKADNKKTKVYG